ncbi:MAG TPA: FAD-dependent oxidoreductase [Solirubrobacterales bacterium]|jgi:NADPH-dependent 2,4-dienoyl-CoA reductase/sulfur reductase-like enzyme|nr:FAD-dependent oxidoreductase [Solirubrobacterales bacterium]
MKEPGVIIVGGGLAAQRAVETLRRRGYAAPVRIVCAEPEPPYDRPPLSKQVLAGTAPEDSVGFRPLGWYEENEVELLLGTRAEAVDVAGRSLTVDSGEALRYDKLLIATGGTARALPFLDHANVHALRTLADARRLRAALVPGARLAIVGAGFIGQEVAATARRLGLEVTIVEALATPLGPILGERLGGWLADLHREEGVRMITGAALEGAGAGGSGRVEELLLADGRRLGCDLVLVGIGTVPATAWLAGSGLDPAGVRVDTCGRTGTPDVFAAGDACIPFDPRYGVHSRTEHWDAAAWQGAAAAKAMLGEYPGTPPLPSFWSDQYGVRIQCVGHPRHADEVSFDGDPAERDFEALFSRGGIPVAGLAVGRPRAIPALRKQIEGGDRFAAEKEVVA